MLACPNCSTPLAQYVSHKGVMYLCPNCSGRAVAFSVLRKDHASQDFLNSLWRKARYAVDRRGRPCPYCHKAMSLAHIASLHGEVDLDVCTRCQTVWFDPKEYPEVPHEQVEPKPAISPEAAEANAMLQLEHLKRRERESFRSDAAAPDHFWQWLPGILGLPVELDEQPQARRPVLTWAIAVGCIAISALLLAAGGVRSAADQWGFLPNDIFRHNGLTLATSFFLHADIWHLLSNMYFFLIFADNAEDHLGRRRFLLLLATAHLAGLALHSLADPRGDIPLVGASGGISGVIAYYAIIFPHARIGMLLRYWFYIRWVSFSAFTALLLFLALQLLLAWMQVGGMTHVSAMGHLGGLAVGVLTGCLARYSRQRVPGV